MLGQHPTPPAIVSSMLASGEADRIIARGGRFLDPGCGDGAFLLEIVRRYLPKMPDGASADWLVGRVVGVENDPAAVASCRQSLGRLLEGVGVEAEPDDLRRIVVEADFTKYPESGWDVIVGNPPYVRVEGISEVERKRYKRDFQSALNRFDLYFIFFEHGLNLLKKGGRLCFITPQKFAQVWSGANLRGLLGRQTIEQIQVIPEDSFPGLITYPAITVVKKHRPDQGHRVVIENLRSNFTRMIPQGDFGVEPWFQVFQESADSREVNLRLSDVCTRIGVGVATGADSIFHVPPEVAKQLPQAVLRESVGGRHLPNEDDGVIGEPGRMIFPYGPNGRLVSPSVLGGAFEYLSLPHHKTHLEGRSCVRAGKKPWYAFHETPRPEELAMPKILTQDIQKEPRFFVDRNGYVPRHSIYYIIPRPEVSIEELADYLNSGAARAWIKENSQHAAGGHFRIQTQTLRLLPVPDRLIRRATLERYA